MGAFAHNRNEFVEKQHKQLSVAAGFEQDQTNKAQEQAKGNFVRGVSKFRDWVTPGGMFDVEAGRYHLYVAANCPWCHRVMLGRSVMGLENVISLDLLFYRRNDAGFWQFLPEEKDLHEHEKNNQALIGGVATRDSIHGKTTVPEIYPAGSTEKSVPILFDRKLNTVVNNESSEILRMMGTVFAPLSRLSHPPALYPPHIAWLIEEINTWVYTDIANGAYRAGFSSVQETYEQARDTYFAGFQRADEILSRRKFLCGEHITEADIRLFPPVYRHDPVYYMRMKLTKAMVRDYPNLQRWLTQMMQFPGIQEASRIQHCLHGYFGRTGAGLVPTIVSRRDTWY
jgi:putative glutathione S-transferase